jgi:alcohol dehydrogenase class IV
METNLRALRSRASSHDVLRRYEDIARVLTGRSLATSDDGVTWIRDLVAALQIPHLATYGITRGEISLIVEAAAKASSMKANPIPLTPAELSAILEHAL